MLMGMGSSMGGSSPEAAYFALPPLTRTLLTLQFSLTLLAVLGLVSPLWIMLDWVKVVSKFQIFRLFTNFLLLGPFSFGWLMHAYLFTSFSSQLETNEWFTVSPGAYLLFLLFQMLSIDVLSYLMWRPNGAPAMFSALNTAIIYYWSRREPHKPVGIWGFHVPGYQLPFALLFLDLLTGNSLTQSLMGLLTGHLFYFIQ